MVPALADFEGRWRLVRMIRQADGQTMRFQGEAVFAPVAGGLRYREAGVLVIPGEGTLRAERDYLWRDAGGRIAVDYADGRAFHDFDPADPQAHHRCDPDDYRVRYDFARWPDWRADWAVTGPRKDYAMTSDYTRG
ncbi:DUF6314 family protein [Phaeovulum sp. NW3]|uniref:DUF6314 family protein n=1 Tax=Phaeovulum sp. NW3 TaxID=2934933 RepID=UPI00202119FE|nr:DUF6314 family protein [Phaeovulum sp. NW3]MCL7464769.1 DUF6314 family protein [Phaeovulum sp. NW3]